MLKPWRTMVWSSAIRMRIAILSACLLEEALSLQKEIAWLGLQGMTDADEST